MNSPIQISVVVPVFNEKRNVEPLADEVLALENQFTGLELIFADDGSLDGTWEVIRAVAASRPAVRGIRTRTHCGQSAAMLMGMRAARGAVIVMMDGDLQNNPADIPALVAGLEGADVVCGYRVNRKDTWSRRAASRVANCMRRWITRDGVRDTGCSLKAFHRECAADLPPLAGMHRFMPAYFQLNGRRIAEVPVDHRARRHGASNYTNLMRLPRTVSDLFGFVWYRRRYRAPGRPGEIEDTDG